MEALNRRIDRLSKLLKELLLLLVLCPAERFNQRLELEIACKLADLLLFAALGAHVLAIDDFRDALLAEGVAATGEHRLFKHVKADRATALVPQYFLHTDLD